MLSYKDNDGKLILLELKLGLSNQRGYSKFQFYKDK